MLDTIVPVTIGIALVFVAAMVFVVSMVRTRCPACRKSLELDLRDNPGGIDATGATSFRCTTCSAEFRRHDKGPLIPRAAWEAGARDELPRAKVQR